MKQTGSKWLAVAVTVVVLAVVLARIGFLVEERQGHQQQAVASVQQAHAGAQTLLGPVLRRHCVEEWQAPVGEGNAQRLETQRREVLLQAVPTALNLQGQSAAELRYRGLFKVNTFTLKAELSAQIQLEGQANTLPVRPGAGAQPHQQGLHVLLTGWPADGQVPEAPLRLRAQLELVGTAQLALVPVAESTRWNHTSDWPHPSFAGRFLPLQREVNEAGFSAQWAVSALASAAPREVLRGAPLCIEGQGPERREASDKPCLDTMAVSFIDPVNPYTLSDRAIKYGLLFVLLTFTAVALSETLAKGRLRRVHPVQYALVGLALCVFFLLLLSLSEHWPFVWGYTSASAAVVALLVMYGRHLLGGLGAGLVFGGGMAALYGLMYVLLHQEQTALLIGSLGLFAALAAVMWLTRRLDWYGLAPRQTPAP